MPANCEGRTSCCKELARPKAEPTVIPPGPGPAPLTAPASKAGGLMPATIAAAAAAVSIELRPTSDCDCDSVSSMLEPAAVLPLAFLPSWSRGSSWQRWPMLRLIHLVQGLSYSRISVIQQLVGLFALEPAEQVQHGTAVSLFWIFFLDMAPLFCSLGGGGKGQRMGRQIKQGIKSQKRKQGLTYEIACHMLQFGRHSKPD